MEAPTNADLPEGEGDFGFWNDWRAADVEAGYQRHCRPVRS
ncbi:MAG TPA: hypothetical protein VKB17_09175 [Thermoleophilaceae bacterium]|nr:hypothetical protein [Thermoleophilaceae bacterium]